MPYILLSRNRPNYEAYEPDSISAWAEEPDERLAPLEAWQEVADLEAALAEAPAFGPKKVEQPTSPEGAIPDNPPME